MKNKVTKGINIFSYGCGLAFIIFTIAFWICFFIIVGGTLWRFPLQTALICTGLAVVIFIVGLISERHSKTLRRH
jgi:cytochrome c oxidase subunit IV